MKKTVLTFGLIAGVMISVLMDGSLLIANKIGTGHNSMLLGYTMMVASFLLIYFNFMPHFMDSYWAAQIHRVQSLGLDPATTAARVAAIEHSQQSYQNPLVNMAYTFMEPLPVGLIITLISAAMLRRKAPAEPAAASAVMTA